VKFVSKLSFFDKKDLTNGIDWFIPCAMNATDIIPQVIILLCVLIALVIWRKMWRTPNIGANAGNLSSNTGSRLNRIRQVSKCVRLILQFGIPLWVIFDLTVFSLLPSYGIKVPFFSVRVSEAHTHDSSMSLTIYGVLLLIVFLFWYRTILKLFGFFEKGVLFTVETVRCIQILGGIYIARFFLALVFKFLLPNTDWIGAGLHDNLFIGFFMIFIGWLIDEARKIREEQELTV
jgi:hypothetical protein